MNSASLCHDFKTPRPDTSRRLPPIFTLVPISFYAALIFGAYFNVNAYLGYRQAALDRDGYKREQLEQQQNKDKLEADKQNILHDKARAEKIAQWVEGTRALQPIGVAIARCLPPEVTLGNLTVERSQDLPSQLVLTVTLNSGTASDVARIQRGVSTLHYRPYNSQQTKNSDVLEYRTMLVWQDGR